MTTRRIVVLELLRAHDDPMRRIDLYNKANEDENFRKLKGEAFWQEDFSWFMSDLLDDRHVTQIKERNKVWYVITEKGLIYLLKVDEPKLHRKLLQRKIRYHVQKRIRAIGWSGETGTTEEDKKIAELACQMVEGDKYVRQRYYRELVMDTARRKDWGDSEADEKFLELVKQKGAWTNEADLALDVETLVQQRRRRLEALDEFFGECFKCGARIHRRDARKVANELAERLGVETGTVCCGCYDKLMGGESQVAEISA